MRKFKLRNGTIVEEIKHPRQRYLKGYPQYVEVVILGEVSLEDKQALRETRSLICLLWGTAMPVGGAHGKGFDVVEELKD